MKSEIARDGMKHKAIITQCINPFYLYIMLVVVPSLCVCVLFVRTDLGFSSHFFKRLRVIT